MAPTWYPVIKLGWMELYIPITKQYLLSASLNPDMSPFMQKGHPNFVAVVFLWHCVLLVCLRACTTVFVANPHVKWLACFQSYYGAYPWLSIVRMFMSSFTQIPHPLSLWLLVCLHEMSLSLLHSFSSSVASLMISSKWSPPLAPNFLLGGKEWLLGHDRNSQNCHCLCWRCMPSPCRHLSPHSSHVAFPSFRSAEAGYLWWSGKCHLHPTISTIALRMAAKPPWYVPPLVRETVPSWHYLEWVETSLMNAWC